MYTIFKNELEIKLTNQASFLQHSLVVLWKELKLRGLDDILNNNASKEVIIYHDDLDTMWQEFKSHFKEIIAGGGVVKNDQNEILFIKRLGFWDLPKGKIEKNESIRSGAIREVKEECGFENLICGAESFATTYHIYEYKGRVILKTSVWFWMQSNDQQLTPQVEEDITDVKWFEANQLREVLQNTYPNIKELIVKYLN